MHNPPDLLIDGRIAIEVRRLNQNFYNGQRHQGIEERDATLRSIIDEVLGGFGHPGEGVSYWVSYRFRNPLPVPRDLKRRLRQEIHAATHSELLTGISIDSLTVHFQPSDRPLSQRFNVGLWVNRDRGGWVLSEMIRNLPICIEEKAAKIERVRHQYPEWWLALVDEINYGATDESDADELRAHVNVTSPWSKILIVGSNGRGLEL